ncbi:uncharacterized protein MYCFIDRAFT_171786 [Pseudocercospora fijiensis CIRAD86]|uniref:Uncharacterized protein n=1 Tax=Pseudocercospora fijiensis (strain CIRAD86) TaxID=383855 RepID=M3B9L2_PSEFD|nr:uncharacterized protein MYCFIDRAFT_171786 [Pseudocercospora fijiensis CIRAD86]EME85948.1 hypothetical protein MYCFIDRAFT_171786 [Pseudocercospora fijiensis CIRAD86]
MRFFRVPREPLVEQTGPHGTEFEPKGKFCESKRRSSKPPVGLVRFTRHARRGQIAAYIIRAYSDGAGPVQMHSSHDNANKAVRSLDSFSETVVFSINYAALPEDNSAPP